MFLDFCHHGIYETQKMSVRWSHSFSDPFSVSNGVRQGSVLSPVLFSVYLDELLEMLGNSGVGCHWGGSFVGALCYADDIVLLAPCASALRHMLNICDSFASFHGLVFNANKTQLICFRRCHTLSNIPTIDITLPFLKEVTHLGHILTYNLDDKPDIIRAVNIACLMLSLVRAIYRLWARPISYGRDGQGKSTQADADDIGYLLTYE